MPDAAGVLRQGGEGGGGVGLADGKEIGGGVAPAERGWAVYTTRTDDQWGIQCQPTGILRVVRNTDEGLERRRSARFRR